MEKEINNKSLISDNRPSFFALILAAHTPITRHLRIPPDFIKYISDELTQNAILSVPSGRHWHIKLQKTEKGMYLQSGWKEFFTDNCLGDNEFLRFTYDGNMCFDVKIFDKSGCERTYASVVTNGGSFPTEKRKRGRPRKIEKNSVSISGKKQGRPKKIDECAPVIEKRKPGRPRKIFGGTSCIHHQLQSCENSSGPDNQQPPPWGSSERPLELD